MFPQCVANTRQPVASPCSGPATSSAPPLCSVSWPWPSSPAKPPADEPTSSQAHHSPSLSLPRMGFSLSCHALASCRKSRQHPFVSNRTFLQQSRNSLRLSEGVHHEHQGHSHIQPRPARHHLERCPLRAYPDRPVQTLTRRANSIHRVHQRRLPALRAPETLLGVHILRRVRMRSRALQRRAQ